MLALSDDELDVVINLAAPLPPRTEKSFLEAMAAELTREARGRPRCGASDRARATGDSCTRCRIRHEPRSAGRPAGGSCNGSSSADWDTNVTQRNRER